MTRLIDADALKEWLQILPNASYTDMVLNTIDDLPTVDAVPAIRCKNCRHMICTASIEHNEGEVTKYYMCNYWHRPTDEDGYCHVAERKDSDAERKS